MLDTAICMYLIKHKSEAVLRHLRNSEPGDLCISAVTFAELLFGVAKSEYRQRNAGPRYISFTARRRSVR